MNNANDNATYIAVGRNCAADFLGSADADSVLDVYEYLLNGIAGLDGDDWSGVGGGRVTGFDLRHFLVTVCVHIRVDGWLGRGAAHKLNRVGQATADQVLGQLCEKDDSKIDAQYKEVTESDIARADAAIAFMTDFAADPKNEDSDYIYNLSTILRLGYVTFKTAGVAASLIATAEKEMGKEIERKRFLNLAKTSKRLGVVGDKLRVRARVHSIRELEGDYGVTSLVKFVTEDESLVVWFASGSVRKTWEKVDDILTIEGKVKKHDAYQGINQTVLTRVVALTDTYLAEEKAKAERKAAREAKRLAKVADSVS